MPKHFAVGSCRSKKLAALPSFENGKSKFCESFMFSTSQMRGKGEVGRLIIVVGSLRL